MKLPSLLVFSFMIVGCASAAPSADSATQGDTTTGALPDLPINLPNAQAAISAPKGDTTLLSWSNDLWEGSLSFDALPTQSADVTFALIDGDGAKTPLVDQKHVDGLKLPVKLVATSAVDGGLAIVQIKNLALEVDSLKPPPAFSGVLTEPADTQTEVATLGADFPGIALHFDPNAQFAANYDKRCSAVSLIDATGQIVTLDHAHPTPGDLALITPLRIIAELTCTTARLGSVDPTATDYTLDVTPSFTVAER